MQRPFLLALLVQRHRLLRRVDKRGNLLADTRIPVAAVTDHVDRRVGEVPVRRPTDRYLFLLKFEAKVFEKSEKFRAKHGGSHSIFILNLTICEASEGYVGYKKRESCVQPV